MGCKKQQQCSQMAYGSSVYRCSVCFTELRKKFPLILTTHLSSSAVSLYEIDFTHPVALVFGNEHDGVSEEIRDGRWKFCDPPGGYDPFTEYFSGLCGQPV